MRSDINELRLFEEIRLNPWKPNDELIIKEMIAKLSVRKPEEAAEYTKRYSDKLDAYIARTNPVAPVAPVVEEHVETITVATGEPPKKRGRRRKILPPSSND